METALATVIVGVGTVGMFALVAASTQQTTDSANVTAGMNLARNVRELSMALAFRENGGGFGAETGQSANNPVTWDDVDDVNGAVLSPPIAATRTRLTEMTGWTQTVTVQNVDPNRLTLTVPNGTSAAARVTVVVSRNGERVCDMTWFVCARSGS